MQLVESTWPLAGKSGSVSVRAALVVAFAMTSACGSTRGEGAGEFDPRLSTPTVTAPAVPSIASPHSAAGAPGVVDPPSGWQRTVLARIAAGEYAIRARNGAFAAFNREHGIGASFEAGVVRVHERNAAAAQGAAADAGFRLAVRALGRTSERAPVTPREFVEGACRKDGAVDEMGACLHRVEARHDRFVEWWENTPAGLEQGFDIAAPPAGRGALQIYIAVEGASVRVEGGGRSATFTLPDGVTVRYGKLGAIDARNARLPVRMVSASGGLSLEVDDTGAAYPIVVDPLLATNINILGSNQAESAFGSCVTSAGDVNGDGYGDVIIGAPRHDGEFPDAGKAYVFMGGAGGLATTPVWSREGQSDGAYFGCPSTGVGDVNGDGRGDIVVAAPQHNGSFYRSGAVYYHRGELNGPELAPNRAIYGSRENANLGKQLVAAGDVDGDGYSDIATAERDGSQDIYSVYRSDGMSLVTPPLKQHLSIPYATLSAGDVNGDGYGDLVIVRGYEGPPGAPYETRITLNAGGPSGIGPVTTSVLPDADLDGHVVGDVNGDGYADLALLGYSQLPGMKLRIQRGSVSGFGAGSYDTSLTARSVWPAGDVNGDGLADIIAIGGTDGSSSLSLLVGGPAKVSLQSTHSLGAGFAFVVGPAGDVDGDGYADVLVGDTDYDSSETDQGRAFVYRGAPGGITGDLTRSPVLPATAAARLGSQITGLGDVNGDGYADVAIAAADYQGMGAAWVFGGSGTGLTVDPVWSRFGSAQGDGAKVAAAGDVNGDGYADLLYARPGYGGANLGRVALYLGNSVTYINQTGAWTVTGVQDDSRVGDAISSAGDVNGDGYADVAIGAPLHNSNGMTGNGRVAVYRGEANPTVATLLWERLGTCAGGRFGYSVAAASDVNGDGLDDLAVGSPYCQGGWIDVYAGNTSAPLATTIMQRNLVQTDARYGVSIDGAGDVNGDGYADVIAGAHLYDIGGGSSNGRVSLHYGGPTPPPDWIATGQSGSRLGVSVAGAGDVNGDGYADLIVGAPLFDVTGATDQGRASVYYGSSSGPLLAWSSPSTSMQAAAEIGATVAGAGDINGDGYSDVLIGAPQYDDGAVDSGKVWFVMGNGPSAGLADVGMRVQARRTGTATPIAPRARSASSAGFDIAVLRAKNPAGRSKVRLQYEVKAFGAAYTGTLLQTTPYVDSAAGVLLQSTASAALGYGTAPHFRVRAAYSPVASAPWSLYSPWRHGGILGEPRGVALRVAP